MTSFLDQDLGKCTKEHDETIYQGILSTQIKLVKAFSLTTSAIRIGCQPILWMNIRTLLLHIHLKNRLASNVYFQMSLK